MSVKLPSDILQADSLQLVNTAITGRQVLEVQNVATQSQLVNGSGNGSYRLCLPIIGAIQNTAGGKIFVDSRGLFYDLKKIAIVFKNVFTYDIEIRCNTPYSYTLGGAETNARSKMRSKIIKPNQSWRIRLPINIRNTLRFPPLQDMTVNALDASNSAIEIYCRNMAILDYAIIISDTPPSTGVISTDADSKLKANSWSPSTTVVEVESSAKVTLETGVFVAGTVQTVRGPTLVHLGLPSLLSIVTVDPQTILSPTVNHKQALSHIRGTAPISAIGSVTPDYIVLTEGAHNYLRCQTQTNDSKRYVRLVNCDQAGNNVSAVAISSLRDHSKRISGPGIVLGGIYNSIYINGVVYDQFLYDFGLEEWVLSSGDNILYVDEGHLENLSYQWPPINKSKPMMYYDIGSTLTTKLTLSWGDVLGAIQGTIDILSVVSKVVSVFV